MSSVLCHSDSQLSFPFKSASHLCTRISPFVYPRFKLKMQSGVKFEIKQWCWFGTQNAVQEYNRLDTTHLIIVTQSVGDLLISHTYDLSQFKQLTFVFYSSSFWLDSQKGRKILVLKESEQIRVNQNETKRSL